MKLFLLNKELPFLYNSQRDKTIMPSKLIFLSPNLQMHLYPFLVPLKQKPSFSHQPALQSQVN